MQSKQAPLGLGVQVLFLSSCQCQLSIYVNVGDQIDSYNRYTYVSSFWRWQKASERFRDDKQTLAARQARSRSESKKNSETKQKRRSAQARIVCE
ncbi:hypothetical protein F5888DRAFT_1368764 [Russula emetica]|nr:hypothetical protein F5888DRAFT_1368764 [Russula emetica]